MKISDKNKAGSARPKHAGGLGAYAARHLPAIIIALSCAAAILAGVFIVRGLLNADDSDAETPQGKDSGYYANSQTVSGGEYLSDISIYGVDVSQSGDDVVISMQFQYESDNSDEAVTLTGVAPAYHVSMMTEPYRLAINIEDLSEWTFTGKTSWLDYPLIGSAFVMQPTRSSADNPTVIFQLNGDAEFRVEEDGGTLKIYLRALDTQERSLYHVVVNGLSEYVTYSQLRAVGLTPTLCSDYAHTMIISEGFETEAEAQAYLDSISDVVSDYLPGKTPEIQLLTGSELPEFADDLEYAEMENMPVIWRDGEKQTAELLEVNSNVLACSPQMDAILCYSPVYTLSATSDSADYSEILYLSNETDTYTKLVDAEFQMVLSAQYSPDGQYVAFLDYDSEDGTVALYICDIVSQTLTLASESDMGDFIYDFVWDNASPTLYAITIDGDGDAHLLSYCLEAADGQRVSTLADLSSTAGMVGATEDAVYYSDTEDDDTCAIFRIDKLTGEVERVMEGARFILSPDGRYLAATGSTGYNTDMGLVVSDLQTGAQYTLPDADLTDFSFSADSQRLLFVVDTGASDTAYPSDVYIWRADTGEFALMFSTAVTDVEWSIDSNCVLLNDTYYTQDSYIPVVYRVRL